MKYHSSFFRPLRSVHDGHQIIESLLPQVQGPERVGFEEDFHRLPSNAPGELLLLKLHDLRQRMVEKIIGVNADILTSSPASPLDVSA